jgi:hypothetical protein
MKFRKKSGKGMSGSILGKKRNLGNVMRLSSRIFSDQII